MALTESLTVEILGDSSQLQQELEQVSNLLQGLQDQLMQAGQGVSQLGGNFQSLSGAIGPLQNLSSQFSALTQQVQTLSQQSITLNVSPALAAIQQLIEAAQLAAQQLAALSLSVGTGGLPGGATAMEAMAPAGYADGGLVTGPSGVDQVPARLSSGEFVLTREAVSAIGVPVLDQLNQTGELAAVAPGPVNGPPRYSPLPIVNMSFASPWSRAQTNLPLTQAHSRASTRPNTISSQQLNNHFGGIEIHVRESADVEGILKELQTGSIGIRNRRG